MCHPAIRLQGHASNRQLVDLVNQLVYNIHMEDKMPVKINIYEAKTNFSELIHRVMAGEEIIIAKAGQPVARLVPADRPREARQPGSAKGKLTIGPDFDDPLPESLLSEMEQ